MDEDKISVISVELVSSNENHEEIRRTQNEKNGKIQNHRKEINKTSAWNMCHIFSVLAVGVVFLAPLTLIPRTNSIFYQSYWYEFNFFMMVFLFLPAVGDAQNMATYFKDKSLQSLQMILTIYSL